MPAGHRVSWFSAGMDTLPDDDSWMDEAEATRIGSMGYSKRRLESTLSRHTAKTTLVRALDLEPTGSSMERITIRNASDGAPEAYLDGDEIDAVLAMTDRADWAVCAVLHGPVRVGCDLELVESRSDAFVRDYFTPAEQALTFETFDRDRHLRANLIWSAKESALKVLRTGLRLDTRTVEVRLPPEPASSGWNPLEVMGPDAVFPGWWHRFGDFVLTIVAGAPVAEPVSLVDPPGLATAVPTHRWLEQPRIER